MKRLWLAACLALAASAATAADAPKDRWIEKSETDKITDQRKVYIRLMADDQVLDLGNWVHKNWPMLLVGCENRQPVLAVGTNKAPKVDEFGNAAVTLRFGGFKPVAETWASAQGGTYLRKLVDPVNASVALTKVDKLLIRYTPREGSDVTLEFTLYGVANHLPKIARACGWDYEQALRRVH